MKVKNVEHVNEERQRLRLGIKKNDNIQNTKKSIKNMIISYTIKLILVVVINISEEVGYREN